MEHVKALLIKFVMCLAVVWIILGGFYNIGFGHVLTISIVLTIVSYLLGDLFLLPRFENWGATISDFILAFAIIWVYSVYFIGVNFPVLTAAGLTSLVLAVGEWFFHMYVGNHVLRQDFESYMEDDRGKLGDRNLRAEFGEEIDPNLEDERDPR